MAFPAERKGLGRQLDYSRERNDDALKMRGSMVIQTVGDTNPTFYLLIPDSPFQSFHSVEFVV
jgi:hypothetical protein